MMNNNIFPCLWYDGDARESAGFYVKVFNGKITADNPMVINVDLFGQKFMLLNGGPHFKKNASVSFTVLCETEDEVQQYWDGLAEDGMVMMPLDSYPWSAKYGWVQDRFGVSWQVYLGEKYGDQKIVPTLMFIHGNNGKAMQAMELYTRTFPNSKIGSFLKYGQGSKGNPIQEPADNIQHAHFKIDGYGLYCMDNSYDHTFDFNEGISMVIMTDNQEQTDTYWDALTAGGGRASMCGWLKDQFGFSWQIVPKKLIELMSDPDPEKAQKVAQAMMTMQKIIIEDLEKAYRS